MPHVAIIIDTLNGGGAEKACLCLAKAMQDEGARVSLIVLKKKCDYIPADTIKLYFLSDNPKLKLHNKKNKNALATQLKDLAMQEGGFDLVVSNLDECHEIVHLADLPNSYYVIHNSIKEQLKRQIRLGPIKYFRKLGTLKRLNGKNIITVSKGLENEVETQGYFTPKSCHTIYNALNIEEIDSLSRIETPDIPTQPYILHIGRLAKQKRHDRLFTLIKHYEGNEKLVLLTKPSSKLQKLISRFKLESKIEILGFKQNPYPYIKHASALILCSDFEGFGLVLAEALACKTPTISTDCPHGPNEILTGKLAQYLAPCEDIEALSKALSKAMATPDDFKDAAILKKLSSKQIANQYLKLAQQAHPARSN